jgi:UDP-glucose 4-epimerase
MKQTSVLITGGAGFIGSHLVDRLLKEKCRVIVYDNFDSFYSGKERNVEYNRDNPNYSLIKDDILNYAALSSKLQGIDIIFHLAAQAGVRYCIENPVKAHDINVTGTMNVLMAAKENEVKKVVYASSSGIFGQLKYVPIDENHPTNPNSPYSATKLAAEKYCLAFGEVYEMDVTCLRYFSVYGPRGRPDQVIYKFAQALIDQKQPIIYGNGQQTRDFTYVDDVVDATYRAATVKGTAGEVFNIGYGREITIHEVLSTVSKALHTTKINPVYQKTYRGEFSRTYADNRKAAKLLGWKPSTRFEDGVNRFIQWLHNSV